MKKTVFYIFFAVIILGSIFGGLTGIKLMDYLFKPLIVVWIALYFFEYGSAVDKKLKAIMLTAFIFSWIGDILLMFSQKGFIYFMLGLVSFLISQLFYVFSFRKSVKLTQKTGFLRHKPIYILPFLIYGLIIYLILYKYLDTVLKFAVPAYMVAILTMSMMALNRKEAVNSNSFFLVFGGSLLFIISDTLLAINKFAEPIPFERLFVLGSYIAAQYLIMRGVIRQFLPVYVK